MFRAQLLGRLLWEVLEEPDQAQVRPGTSLGRAYSGLVNRALASPGASWRVLVAPPVAAAQQRGLAADMAAMARANSKKAAVMLVSVVRTLANTPPVLYCFHALPCCWLLYYCRSAASFFLVPLCNSRPNPVY